MEKTNRIGGEGGREGGREADRVNNKTSPFPVSSFD